MVYVNKRRMTPVFICPYCGCFTPKIHHSQVYCHKSIKPCAKYARREYETEYHKLWDKKFKHDNNLGTENLREHRQKDFADELERIIQSKRKIKRIDISAYEDKVEEFRKNEVYI